MPEREKYPEPGEFPGAGTRCHRPTLPPLPEPAAGESRQLRSERHPGGVPERTPVCGSSVGGAGCLAVTDVK